MADTDESSQALSGRVLSGALSRRLSATLAIQILGPLSSILAVLVIARWGGPTLQGEFVTYKTLTDLLVIAGMFGLPQAYIYLINKSVITVGAAVAFTYVYTVLSVLISAGIIWFQYQHGYLTSNSGSETFLYVLVLALGVGGYILHGLARGIVLTHTDGQFFSIFSVAPAIALLFYIGVQVRVFTPDFAMAIGLVGCISGVAAAAWAAHLARPDFAGLAALPYRTLFSQSLQVFFQAVLSAAQPITTIAMLRMLGGTIADVGNFSIAAAAMSAVNVAVSIIAPILFNRWSKSLSKGQIRNLMKMTLIFATIIMLAASASALLAPYLVPLIFGQGFVRAVPSVQLLLLTALPLLFTRIMSPAVHAIGHPGVNTISCMVRLGICVAGLYLLHLAKTDLLIAAAIAWLTAEWIAMLVQWICIEHLLRSENVEESNAPSKEA